MAKTERNSLLGGLTRAMRAQQMDLADTELLAKALAANDESAFEAIVRRHGPMVYRVCWRILQNGHDTEDAFQGTFLIFAQKVRTVRNLASLGSWLHRVARQVALKARVAAAARIRHESNASEMTHGGTDSGIRVDTYAVLDAEMEALPEKWRQPLVLCYFEGRTLDDAARLLNWSKSTLRRRLDEAREALATRLHRRGVIWSTAFAGVLVSDCASLAVLSGLLRSTVDVLVAVVVGDAVPASIPAQVLTLIEGASKPMFTTRHNLATSKMALLLLSSVAVVGASLGLASGRFTSAHPTRLAQQVPEQDALDGIKGLRRGQLPQADAPIKAKDTAIVKVRGRVLDPDGNPVAGAKLYLNNRTPKGEDQPFRATSAKDGGFDFTFARPVTDQGGPARPTDQVLAVAEGYGCAAAAVGAAEEELILRLVKDEPIKGRILDADGKPVVRARIAVTFLADDLARYLEWKEKGEGGYTFAKIWDGPLPGQPAAFTTDAEGRFALTGVGRERIVRLRVEGSGIATEENLEVMTRAGKALDFKIGEHINVSGAGASRARTMDLKGRRVYGASFDYLAAASRTIRGVVRVRGTGKALAGVTVEATGPAGNFLSHAVTDKEGRYELVGLAKSPNYWLRLKPADGLSFGRDVKLDDTLGLGALAADIETSLGARTVSGKVTDKHGKPVAGAAVVYRPLFPNGNLVGMDGWNPRSETITGADGSYALRVLPGIGVIGVTGPDPDAYTGAQLTEKERKDVLRVADPNYGRMLRVAIDAQNFLVLPEPDFNALALFDLNPKNESVVRDVVLERAEERKGRVVGPDGQPLAGVSVQGLSARTSGDLNEVLQGAEFTVRGIDFRQRTRALTFHHPDKNLGFHLKELPDEKSWPLTVKLLPCGSFSGRIVDQDGNPLAGCSIYAFARLGGGLDSGPAFSTGKDGRFRADGLVPGVEYSVWRRGRLLSNIHPGAVIESGKHTDLGDIKVAD